MLTRTLPTRLFTGGAEVPVLVGQSVCGKLPYPFGVCAVIGEPLSGMDWLAEVVVKVLHKGPNAFFVLMRLLSHSFGHSKCRCLCLSFADFPVRVPFPLFLRRCPSHPSLKMFAVQYRSVTGNVLCRLTSRVARIPSPIPCMSAAVSPKCEEKWFWERKRKVKMAFGEQQQQLAGCFRSAERSAIGGGEDVD